MTIQTIIIGTVITTLPIGFLIPETFIKCGDVGGVFVNGKVYVCDIGDTEFTKYHEIGHKVYMEMLTKEQKDSYITLYNKHYKLGMKAFYRTYSMTNVLESFGDDFAIMMTKKKTNIYLKKRIKFIQSIIHN